MPTKKQQLGEFGEKLIIQKCSCPKCKRDKTLKRLPPNFKCADIICDFCGYLAQVKTCTVSDVLKIPNSILGAAWGPQKERMDAGIYMPLFIVLKSETESAIYYVPTDLQTKEMFAARNPLSSNAKRKGWQGYSINFKSPNNPSVIRILLNLDNGPPINQG